MQSNLIIICLIRFDIQITFRDIFRPYALMHSHINFQNVQNFHCEFTFSGPVSHIRFLSSRWNWMRKTKTTFANLNSRGLKKNFGRIRMNLKQMSFHLHSSQRKKNHHFEVYSFLRFSTVSSKKQRFKHGSQIIRNWTNVDLSFNLDWMNACYDIKGFNFHRFENIIQLFPIVHRLSLFEWFSQNSMDLISKMDGFSFY